MSTATKYKIILIAKGTDSDINLECRIVDASGNPVGPAAMKEGDDTFPDAGTSGIRYKSSPNTDMFIDNFEVFEAQ